MSTTREKVAALMPLVERMSRAHCWLPRTLDQTVNPYLRRAKPTLIE